jgi:RHS repeat-associated protein
MSKAALRQVRAFVCAICALANLSIGPAMGRFVMAGGGLAVLAAAGASSALLYGGKSHAQTAPCEDAIGDEPDGDGDNCDYVTTPTTNDSAATSPDDSTPVDDNGGNCPGGCTTWSVAPEVVSLTLHDRPVGYTPAVGPAIQFDVYYAQRDTQQPLVFTYTNLGPKWTIGWLSYVSDMISANGNAILYERGGGADTYGFASASAAQSSASPYTQAFLTRTTDSAGHTTAFTRILKDGSSQTFASAQGNVFFMTAVTDLQGNAAHIAYDTQGRITTITDAIGQVTTFTYGASDPLKLTKITDPFGRSASFAYTSAGQLASITDTIGITSQYTYGPGNFVNTLTTPYGKTTFAFTDATTNASLGTTRTLTATDALGRVSRVEYNDSAPGYPDSETATPTGIAFGDYQLSNRNSFIWNPEQYKAATASGGLDYTKAQVTHWLYMADHLTVSRVPESKKQPLEARVWFNYGGQIDALTQGTSNQPTVAARVLDNGATQLQSFTYNSSGNVTSSTDPAGRKLSFTYAANGVDLLSAANTTGGGNQLLGTYTYNSQHLPTKIVGVNGGVTQIQYNAAGQRTQVTDALNNVTSYTYDKLGNLTAVQGPIAAAQYSFTYDAVNRVHTATDPTGYSISYAYDAADRPTGATYPDGTTTAFTYNLLDMVSSTDRLGQKTQLTYDAERQLTKVTDPLGQATQFTYTLNGKLASITDPNNHATTTARDIEDRVTTKTYADGTKQVLAYESAIGRVHTATDARAQATTYAYNLDNSTASVTYTNAPKVSFTYDGAYPRVVTMTDGIGTTTYAYNPVAATPALGANQLKSVTSPVPGAAAGTTDTVAYGYDALGRVISRTVNGAAQTTTFDALGRVTGVTNPLDAFTYAYADGTSRVSAVSSGHGPKAALTYYGGKGDELIQQMTFTTQSGSALSQYGYSYNADDNVTQFTESYVGQKLSAAAIPTDASRLGGGPTMMAGLDKALGSASGAASQISALVRDSLVTAASKPVGAHRPASLPDVTPVALWLILFAMGAGLTLAAAWRARALGRMRNWVAMTLVGAMLASCSGGGGSSTPTPPAPPPPPPPTPTSAVIGYSYDTANRLTAAQVGTNLSSGSGSPQYAYGYDPASNLTSIAANAPAQALAYTSTNAISTGTYDANGSPTLLNGNSYSWDGTNRLASFISGSNESDFTYDGQSRLVRIVDKQAGKVVDDRAFTWCGDSRCAEHDNTTSGSPVSKQFFDQGEMVSGAAYYYVADRLGSVRQLVDANGTVQAQYEYDPYGNQTQVSGSKSADFGFAGYFYHAASGLNFALYRAYDAKDGRWLNRDPIGEDGGVNLYGYVGGNPLVGNDWSGLVVYVGEHGAFFPSDPLQHTAIVLQPDNPQDFNFPNNTYTLGGQAGGSWWTSWSLFGNLQSKPNFPGDSPGSSCNPGPLQNLTPVGTPDGMTDTQFIQALINASQSYNNDQPYDPFPDPFGIYYNSNSYTSGVIEKAGGTPPSLPGVQPGYGMPLPIP